MMSTQNASAGKVTFYLGDEEFLFFTPNRTDPSLSVLESSMWFKRVGIDGNRVFRSPSSLESLEWLRDNLGPITLSREVYSWYVRTSSLAPIAGFEESPIHDYQREATGFLVSRDKAMLSLSPGLGKTLVSILAANELGLNRILVVSPLSLLYMWKSELEKWSKFLRRKPTVYIWHNAPPASAKSSHSNFVWWITNPETIVRQGSKIPNQGNLDLLILDESTLYKNRKAQRTRRLLDIAKKADRTWLLTGSPATRFVDDLWSQFNLLKPKTYTSYWRFAKEYCIVDETPWGTKVAANKKNAETIIKKRFRDIYFARSQEEVLDIPDWLFEEIDIPMTPYQDKIYSDIKEKLKAELEGENENTVVHVSNHLSSVVRLLQAASNPILLGGDKPSSGKWDALPELLKLYPAPFLIWTSFIKSAKMLTDNLYSLGMKSAFMIGETPPSDRQKLVDSYQEGKLDALILGQSVGSFGLTLTAARTAIYLERNFDGSYFQSLHRFRRIGTTQSPVVLHLRSLRRDGGNTVDHLVHGMLDYRVNMIQSLTVGMLKGV